MRAEGGESDATSSRRDPLPLEIDLILMSVDGTDLDVGTITSDVTSTHYITGFDSDIVALPWQRRRYTDIRQRG